MDASSNSSGMGAGAIMTNLDKTIEIQCVLRFEFEATNNEVEYEPVIIAIELAYNIELKHIKFFCDSQLVVGQNEGTFEEKNEKMSLYCLRVHDLRRKFLS